MGATLIRTAALLPIALANNASYLAHCEIHEDQCLQTAPDQYHTQEQQPVVHGTRTDTSTSTNNRTAITGAGVLEARVAQLDGHGTRGTTGHGELGNFVMNLQPDAFRLTGSDMTFNLMNGTSEGSAWD